MRLTPACILAVLAGMALAVPTVAATTCSPGRPAACVEDPCALLACAGCPDLLHGGCFDLRACLDHAWDACVDLTVECPTGHEPCGPPP
ncbi:MAG TPA: hypothetical protein VNX21_08110 [Candidatus Thermoplasmatota archaeon]|nr:hypothetical protein [Candidatus Thermoplasmatota archaeon]